MELLSRIRQRLCLIGVSLVLLFLQSVLRVSVVNRQKGDRLALILGHVAHTTVAHVASRRHTYDRIQDALAWVLPVYVLSLIIVWFALVQTGFSLMIWSLQAEPSLFRAFIASGSALSTLGFLTPPDLSGQLLAIPEGAFGLGIVVFFFHVHPGYQTRFRRASREWRGSMPAPARPRRRSASWSGCIVPAGLAMQPPFGRTGKRGSDCSSKPIRRRRSWPSSHPFTADKAGWLPPRQFGYPLLVAFVPRRQGPRGRDALLQHGGERPESDCRAPWKAADPRRSPTTGRALELRGLRSALSSPCVG